MKIQSSVIRFIAATVLFIIVSQSVSFANTNMQTMPAASLSAGQIMGSFTILLALMLFPLVKRRAKNYPGL